MARGGRGRVCAQVATPETFSAFTSLIAAACACDLVRVATIKRGPSTARSSDLPGANLHTNYAHDLYSPNPDTAGAVRQAMTDYTGCHA